MKLFVQFYKFQHFCDVGVFVCDLLWRVAKFDVNVKTFLHANITNTNSCLTILTVTKMLMNCLCSWFPCMLVFSVTCMYRVFLSKWCWCQIIDLLYRVYIIVYRPRERSISFHTYTFHCYYWCRYQVYCNDQ